MSYRKLTARWSKKENDILLDYPRSCDGHYLCSVFNNEFVKEMIDRGYDIKSIKFSIDVDTKHPDLATKFPLLYEDLKRVGVIT